MKLTHVEMVVHSGAETVTDQLAGTIVESAPAGRRRPVVRIAVINNTAITSKFSCRAGSREIARNSFCLFDAGGDLGKAVFHQAEVDPGAKIDLELVAGAASTSIIIVQMEY